MKGNSRAGKMPCMEIGRDRRGAAGRTATEGRGWRRGLRPAAAPQGCAARSCRRKKITTPFGVVIFGRDGQNRYFEISKGYRRTTQPAFWPAALLRRASVLPQAKPRRRRNSPHSRWRLCRLTDVAYPLRVLPPSIEIPKGGAGQRSAKPKKKDTLKACLSFWYARLDSNQRPTESESVTLSS